MLKLDNAARLVLGMSSTAPLDEATAFFARATKRLKALPEPPFEIKDLTAALSQLEGHSEGGLTFEYTVPANPDTLTLSDSALGADAAARQQLREAVDLLLAWQWADAVEAAKAVLIKTDREDLRDEALNVLAAATTLLGNSEAGIAALRQAVEGEWNFALQQNLGILALGEDPELAAQQSTYWLDGAGSREDRERALFFVMNMWASLEHEDEVALPDRIRESFRGALREDLSLETFTQLGMFLARNDSEWMTRPGNWIVTPHATSEVAHMVLARAEGFDAFIDFLVEHTNNPVPEIARTRENFIAGLIEAMFEEEPAMWAAGVAMNFIDRGLACDSMNNALLRLLAIREICLYFREREGEPKEEFITWLEDVRAYIASIDDESLRDYLKEMLSMASGLFAIGYVVARETEIQSVAGPLTTIYEMAQSWGSRRRLNKHVARQVAGQASQWARETGAYIQRLLALPLDPELAAAISEFNNRRAIIWQMAQETMRKI